MPSMAAFAIATALFFVTALGKDTTCQSFGVDFQNNGTYFQDSRSTAPFTAIQEFSGCQDDVSYNILVEPNGDYVECSQTPTVPDDTPQEVIWYVALLV